MFVSFEGVDGAGKSTQAELLAGALGTETVLVREPGGTPAGERLRELLKDPGVALDPRAELLLFLAARAQLVEAVIRPALEAGRDVVCDRFMDSTVAYQGVARGLGAETVRELNAVAVAGCVPDRTLLLALDAGRAAGRGEARGDFGADRFEGAGEDFRGKVAAAFAEIATAEPERVTVVDGSGTEAEVHGRVLAALGLGPAG
ncbi:MAG TPA: dTMP kinase [Solirubrobacterales bacterium]|nr:dTMP kinase [Solirubrobacterales bacterium]